jgi:hypothetical protein
VIDAESRMEDGVNRPPFPSLELLQKGLLLALLCGILLLLVEIRFEHSTVMGEKWQSWIPVIYLSALVILTPLAMAFLRSFGQILLVVLFSGLIIVGTLGFFFHGKGKPVQQVWHVIATDLEQPGHVKVSDDEETTPPILAPLALAGLGTIGVLVCFLSSVITRNRKSGNSIGETYKES